jgi:acyl-CoA thioesterase-1
MYPALSKEYKTVLMPFFLEGVAARLDLNQEDGIHPTARGYVVVTENVMKTIEPLLSKSRNSE